MSQSDTVSNILERITQETAQVTTKKKIFGMKSKRTTKTPRPQKKVVLESSNSSSSTANNMSPASSPFRAQLNQIPPRSQSMPVESNTLSQDSISSTSSTNLNEYSTNSQTNILDSNDSFFDDQWLIISPCIDNIFEQGSEGKFEPAFQAVERLCRNKQYCEKMNNQLLLKIDSFANIISKKLHPPVNYQSVTSVLDFIQRSNTLLASIFSTFERSFLAPQLTIEQLVHKHITKAIHVDQSIADGICSATIDEINNQRQKNISEIDSKLNINDDNQKGNSKEINNQSPKNNLNPYQQTAFVISQFDLTKDIIKPLESDTADFYSKIKLNDNSSKILLKHIQLIIESEEQIMNFFAVDIQKVSISKARDIIYVKRFIMELPQIIQTIMDSNDSDSMTLLSSLVSNSSSENLLKKFISSYSDDIRQRCEVILSISSEQNKNDNLNNDKIIPELIQIHSTMINVREIIGKQSSDMIFRAFKNTINEVTFKVAFLLAKYCHEMILSDPHAFTESITKIINLFRELESMDVFFTHYKEFLTVRLLKGTFDNESEAVKAEKSFIEKIEGICGEEDVAPMREMIKDSESWNELNEDFMESLNKKQEKSENIDNEIPLNKESENDQKTSQKEVEEESSHKETDNKGLIPSDNDIDHENKESPSNEANTEQKAEANDSPTKEAETAQLSIQEQQDIDDQNEFKKIEFPIFIQTFNSSQFQPYSCYTLNANEDKKKEGEVNKFFPSPSGLLNARSQFSKFYTETYARKSIKWLPLLDQVTIQLNDTTINCSSLYYYVLDSIINGRPLKESGIDEKTFKELTDTLISTNIILCNEKNDNDKIFDCHFSIASNNEKKTLNLPDPSLLTPKMLKNEKMGDIFAMRRMRIEAALVLTMKRLKVAQKEVLFEKMKENVNFRASNEDLEKCLSDLITKSYIIKDEKDNIVFTTE
ncbi:hypothetical protein M9Y10_013680 [Tritrichomonas musculus]|uniref:Cullin family profile domain-containing protein n=1 Tax=Tritrichomonas musculus TaxID=1915356 RepID=A0ABR2KXI0_9EUKA